MKSSRRILLSTLFLGLAGAIGPLVYFTCVEYQNLVELMMPDASALFYFADQSLHTLWPTRLLGGLPAFEARYGIDGGGYLLVSANILFFAAIGLFAGLFARRSNGFLRASLFFTLAMLAFQLWCQGWSLDFFYWAPFVLAMLALQLPFLLMHVWTQAPAPPGGSPMPQPV